MKTQGRNTASWWISAMLALPLAACGGIEGPPPYAEQRAVGMHELIIETNPKGEISEVMLQEILELVEIVPMPAGQPGFALQLERHELNEAHRVFMTPPTMVPWIIDATYQPPVDELPDAVASLWIEVTVTPDVSTMVRLDEMNEPAIPPIHQMIQVWRLPDIEGPFYLMDPWENDTRPDVPPFCQMGSDGKVTWN